MIEPQQLRSVAAGGAALLSLVLANGVGLAAEPASSPSEEVPQVSSQAALPDPDLSTLPAPVAEQLNRVRRELMSDLIITETPPSQIGERVGELGRLYHAYQLLEPAAECYRAAAELTPRDARWPYLSGILSAEHGHSEEAARSFERALALVPGAVPAFVRLGRVYADLGRQDAAEWLFREALLREPASAAAEAALGELLVTRERFLEAEELLRSALQRQPGADRLYDPLSRALAGRGAESAGRAMQAKAGPVEVHLTDPLVDDFAEMTLGERVHLLRGRAAYQAGRFAEAADEYRQATELEPESAVAHLNLGAALGQLDDTAGALAQYRQAVAADSESQAARVRLGTALAADGDMPAATEQFEAAVLLSPRDEEARFGLAEVLRRDGRLDDALAHYRQAAELDPPGEIARFREAQILADLGRYAEARDRLEEGHALAPRSGVIALTLARLLAGAPDLALRDGARALEILNSAPIRRSLRAFETLAMAYAETGECDRAVEWQSQAWEAALDFDDQSTAEAMERTLEHYRQSRPCRFLADDHLAPGATPEDGPD